MALSILEKIKLQKIAKDGMRRIKDDKTLSPIEIMKLLKSVKEAFRQLNATLAAQPEGSVKPESVKTLNDILAGKYDSDPSRTDKILSAIEELDKDPAMSEKYGSLMDQALDYDTQLLAKKKSGGA